MNINDLSPGFPGSAVSPGSPGGIDRRRLLTAAAGLGLGIGSLGLAGCATSRADPGPSIGRVVVVGAGFGGSTAARYLRLWGGNVEVTVVERLPQFISCPLSNLVIGGQLGIERITRGYDGLRAAGVRVVQGEVSTIDAAARTVRLADGSTLPWDRLLLSPGIDFMTAGIDGLEAALASGRVAHAWKAGPQTLMLRAQLQALPEGGVVAMTVPRTPYRCPPGPYERACLIASWLRANKPRAKLLVLDANPEISSKKSLFEAAFRDRHAGVLEYRANTELRQVLERGSRTVARTDFDDVAADVLNVIPPQRGADLARSAGLLNLNGRWAGVDWLSLESTALPRVHVLGDTTFSAPAMPKSGHMANQHGKVAAAAIIQMMKGEPVDPAPMVSNTCYSYVDPNEAVHVASVHAYNAAERTFKTVTGSGGVSDKAGLVEGQHAWSWGQNIWADMLGAGA